CITHAHPPRPLPSFPTRRSSDLAGEITVGTAIHVEHRAATGIGSEVHAEAAMESFDGRFYTMRVRAWTKDAAGEKELGRGTVSQIGRAAMRERADNAWAGSTSND